MYCGSTFPETMMNVSKFIYFAIYVKEVLTTLRDFATCHDDFGLKPPDGVLKTYTYKWLGFVYYKHVNTAVIYQLNTPRVVLIHKQFVLSTANDLLQLPKNFVLGSVVFGDYERDEDECRLSPNDVKMGAVCPPAYFETIIVTIEAHPEYKRFGIKNTLALGKLARPLRSAYMLPVCLPSLSERKRIRRRGIVFMVDYLNKIPVQLETEKLAKRTVKMYTHNDCKRYRIKEKPNNTDELSNTLCTTGCGVRSGAVIVSHDTDGLFELIGISVGSAPCKKRHMRTRLNKQSPMYIDVYPYITWITNMVTASTVPKPYLANFALAGSGLDQSLLKNMIQKRNGQKYVWRGRTFVIGNGCFRPPKYQKKMAFFYYETFKVNTKSPARLWIYMKISAGIECTITCARLLFPNRSKSPPLIDGIGGFNISLQMETKWFPDTFHFTLRLSGSNSTSKNIDLWWSQRGPGLW